MPFNFQIAQVPNRFREDKPGWWQRPGLRSQMRSTPQRSAFSSPTPTITNPGSTPVPQPSGLTANQQAQYSAFLAGQSPAQANQRMGDEQFATMQFGPGVWGQPGTWLNGQFYPAGTRLPTGGISMDPSNRVYGPAAAREAGVAPGLRGAMARQRAAQAEPVQQGSGLTPIDQTWIDAAQQNPGSALSQYIMGRSRQPAPVDGVASRQEALRQERYGGGMLPSEAIAGSALPMALGDERGRNPRFAGIRGFRGELPGGGFEYTTPGGGAAVGRTMGTELLPSPEETQRTPENKPWNKQLATSLAYEGKLRRERMGGPLVEGDAERNAAYRQRLADRREDSRQITMANAMQKADARRQRLQERKSGPSLTQMALAGNRNAQGLLGGMMQAGLEQQKLMADQAYQQGRLGLMDLASQRDYLAAGGDAALMPRMGGQQAAPQTPASTFDAQYGAGSFDRMMGQVSSAGNPRQLATVLGGFQAGGMWNTQMRNQVVSRLAADNPELLAAIQDPSNNDPDMNNLRRLLFSGDNTAAPAAAKPTAQPNTVMPKPRSFWDMLGASTAM